MHSIKGAIFDLDGTLLNSMPIWETVAVDYLKTLGITPKSDIEATVRVMSIQQACEHFCLVYGITLSVAEITAGINRMVEDFYFNHAPLKPGVREALKLLRSQQVKMCVATATDRYLVEAALQRLSIRQYFEQIFTCTEVGAGKDQPDIFHTALTALGTMPSETLVFEDALYAIRTAKKLGVITIGLYDHSFSAAQEDIRNIADRYYVSLYDWFNDFTT